MEEAEKLSDRICIIDNGKLLVTGNASEIKKISGYEDVVELDIEGDIANTFIPFIDPDLTNKMVIADNRVAFSVRDPISAASAILEVIKKRDLKVSNMRLRKTSLEDIFISLTGRKIRE
jgi:ABC-2 type transport system ATP-binding protein